MQATPKELVWVIRVGIFVVAAIATAMGLTIDSIYGLWYLCSDLVFVVLFPHLLCAVHVPFVNIYGSITGYIFGLLLRLGGGEPLISLEPFIEYPYFRNSEQLFPFRTFSMIVTLVTLITVSLLTNVLFESGMVPVEYDFLKAMERQGKHNETQQYELDVPKYDNPN